MTNSSFSPVSGRFWGLLEGRHIRVTSDPYANNQFTLLRFAIDNPIAFGLLLNIMGDFLEFLRSKKNFTSLLVFGILVLALPIGLNLIKTQQIFSSRAAQEKIVIPDQPNVITRPNGEKALKLNAQGEALVTLELTGDFPPATATTPQTSQTTGGLIPEVYADGVLDVITDVAGDITDKSVTLRGYASTANNSASVWFRLSSIPRSACADSNDTFGGKFDFTTRGAGGIAANQTRRLFVEYITHTPLAANTTYYYCAVIQDNITSTQALGEVKQFTTLSSSGGTTPPGSGTTCTSGTWDANRCATCNNVGQWNQTGGNFGAVGGNATQAQWCSCAERYSQSQQGVAYNAQNYPNCVSFLSGGTGSNIGGYFKAYPTNAVQVGQTANYTVQAGTSSDYSIIDIGVKRARTASGPWTDVGSAVCGSADSVLNTRACEKNISWTPAAGEAGSWFLGIGLNIGLKNGNSSRCEAAAGIDNSGSYSRCYPGNFPNLDIVPTEVTGGGTDPCARTAQICTDGDGRGGAWYCTSASAPSSCAGCYVAQTGGTTITECLVSPPPPQSPPTPPSPPTSPSLPTSPSPSPENCPSDIQSTEARVRGRSADPWSSAETVFVDQQIEVAGFHNNRTNTPSLNITGLEATGPEGPMSQTVDILSNPGTFKPTLPGRYTITAKVPGKTGANANNCRGQASLNVNELPVATRAVKIAEDPAGLADASEIPYTSDPLIAAFKFADTRAGAKNIWVEFIYSNNNIVRKSAQIDLILDPEITNIQGSGCKITTKENEAIFEINGKNFGKEKGTVSSDGTLLKIEKWQDSHVKVTLSNPPVGQSFPITLKDANGLETQGACSALSQLAVSAKLFCKLPQKAGQDSVKLILAEGVKGGKVERQTIKIDKNGLIEGLSTPLVEKQGYKLAIKAPKSVRRVTEFFAEPGTTVLSTLNLPIGDICPEEGDGKINSIDRACLNRQWRVLPGTSARTADFNDDGLVNSLDAVCMRRDFGAEDAQEPAAGPLSISPPQTSPSPSPSLSSSPTVTPSASPSPSPAPTLPTATAPSLPTTTSPSLPTTTAPSLPAGTEPNIPSGTGPSGDTGGTAFRVSFDPSFPAGQTTTGNLDSVTGQATIDLTLTGPLGQKSVYVQFLENNTWGPTPPLVTSVTLT